MRKGTNPAKFVAHVEKPQQITVAVLNYIPFMSGFYAQTLDVLKTCLGTIWDNTDLPYDLLVFDNGSCQEVIDFLTNAQDDGKIQYLMLSEKNMGKGGAWNMMLKAAPGEIIAYADNDVYFYPGWLSKAVQILEHFPHVGMVTSRPYRTEPASFSNTVKWAEETTGVELQHGKFLSFEDFAAFEMSLGATEEIARLRYNASEDIRFTYKGLTVQAGASHWQFVGYKSVIEEFLPFSMDRPMRQVKQLDQRMNEAGYLRLMPIDILAQNISNSLDWIHKPEQPVKAPPAAAIRRKKRLLQQPLVKRVLLGMYDRIFRWYYE